MSFCVDVYEQYDCDTVVFIGDVVDWTSVSFHAKHPAAPGPEDEYSLALECIGRWKRMFPHAFVTIGNHDDRLIRLAQSVGIPGSMLRSYADVWDTPGWAWLHDMMLENVYYFHGIGRSGINPAYNTAKQMGCSVVQGHVHTAGGIKWIVSPNDRRFGLDTGCGIDDRLYAFAYGKHMKAKSVLSCGVVLDGIGQHIIMPAGRGEKYDRHRFPENPLIKNL